MRSPKKTPVVGHINVVDDIRAVNKHSTLDTIHENAIFSASYIILLVASTVICTLGLLTDSPAIIIGGMIVSPMMWPLLKIAAGISLGRRTYVSQALFLLLMSIAVSLASSFVITLISPIKVLSTEILARTQPTLIDICIALAVGVVAAMAVVIKKISSNLAGVAIAASLMPPLCVGGIGLALWHPQTVFGGLLLFFANILSIVFVSIFVFRFLGIEIRKKRSLTSEGIIFVGVMLIITALPLFMFLRNYTFEARSYQKSQQVLTTSLSEISPEIFIQNIKTTMNQKYESGETFTRVEADVLVPEDITIDYAQKEQMIATLEHELQRNVVLDLRIQTAIALQTETDATVRRLKTSITKIIRDELSQANQALTIDGISITKKEDASYWDVDVVMRSDPSAPFTQDQRDLLEQKLRDATQAEITLNVEVISRLKLQGEYDVNAQKIQSDIRALFEKGQKDVHITELDITYDKQTNTYSVYILLATPRGEFLKKQVFEGFQALLGIRYQAEFIFTVDQVEKTTFSL